MSRISLIHLFPIFVALGAFGCSPDGGTSETGSGGQGSGGTSSSGGNSGSGGTGTGGATGSGGAGTGGATGSGGTSATGGTSASGGRSATGGTSATGGATGTGGATTSGGAGGGGGRATGGSGGMGGNTGGRGGGVGGTAATGGSGGFNPCKASPCVILPLGDSITHGYESTDDGGYRSALFKLIVAANQNVTFIGSLSNGPDNVSSKKFPKNHEGHDGISVSGITGYVPPAKAFSTTPHIVLLHIGTNDMTSNADPTTTANRLSTLVTNLVNAAPNALIVVAKIIPLGYSNSNYTSYIAKIPDVVKAQTGKNVIMVDMSTLPSSSIRGSGDVHPTDKGYSDIANLWYGAIKDYLPQ